MAGLASSGLRSETQHRTPHRQPCFGARKLAVTKRRGRSSCSGGSHTDCSRQNVVIATGAEIVGHRTCKVRTQSRPVTLRKGPYGNRLADEHASLRLLRESGQFRRGGKHRHCEEILHFRSGPIASSVSSQRIFQRPAVNIPCARIPNVVRDLHRLPDRGQAILASWEKFVKRKSIS
jgi:hypothetical protein